MRSNTRRMRAAATTLAILSTIVALACTRKPTSGFDQIPSEKAHLMEGIDSYQSEQQFEVFLAQQSLRAKSDATRGNFVVLTVPRYKHLDCEGRLEATFVFDRLMAVSFSPSDANKYRDGLSRLGISFKRNDDIVFRGKYTKLVSGRDAGGRFYLWEDTRLERLEQSWNDYAERHSG